MPPQIISQDKTTTKAKRLLAMKQRLDFTLQKFLSFLTLISLLPDLENQKMFGKGLPLKKSKDAIKLVRPYKQVVN